MNKDLEQIDRVIEMISSVITNLTTWLGSIRVKADSVKVKILEAIDLETKDFERIKSLRLKEQDKLSQVKDDVDELDTKKGSLTNDIALLIKHKEELIQEYVNKETRYIKVISDLASTAKQRRLDVIELDREVNSLKKQRKNVK